MATENINRTEDNVSQENKEQFTAEEAENEVTDAEDQPEAGEEEAEEETAQNQESAKLRAELNEMKDKYLRLYSEFDNFRKRTAKEKADLFKTANQDLMTSLLPVLDDLERARNAMEAAKDVAAVKEGVELVFHKIGNTLQQKGLKAMEAIGEPFDPDLHEAITQVPAPEENMKGKVIDEVEKGYSLGDKVIRFAKVIIGA
jgi:molecular chaperone GrpE